MPTLDAHGTGSSDHGFNAVEGELFDGRDVVRAGESITHKNWSMKRVVVVFGTVFSLTGDSETGGDVEIHGGGCPTIKKTGSVVNGFDR